MSTHGDKNQVLSVMSVKLQHIKSMYLLELEVITQSLLKDRAFPRLLKQKKRERFVLLNKTHPVHW